MPIVNSATPYRWFEILADVKFSILAEPASSRHPPTRQKAYKKVKFDISKDSSDNDSEESKTATENDEYDSEPFPPVKRSRVKLKPKRSLSLCRLDGIIGFAVFAIFILVIGVITGIGIMYTCKRASNRQNIFT